MLKISRPDGGVVSYVAKCLTGGNILKYLSFLLSGDPPEPICVERLTANGDVKNGQPFQSIPIFENLMVTARRRPDRLRLIENLIERVKANGRDGKPIVSETFKKSCSQKPSVREKWMKEIEAY